MNITLIVAASENNAIGKQNQLLWNLPNDLKFFKNNTWGLAVAMGRKTFESLGNKPLTGRFNIVITRQKDWKAHNVTVVESLEESIKTAKENDYKEVMICGGGEIYKQAILIATKILITRVHATLEGDTFFPVIDENIWKLVFEENFEADEKHAYAYSFQTWIRK
ncbi:dihydrofolate reductase [Chitinophagaceae bacterium LWZ2-11]